MDPNFVRMAQKQGTRRSGYRIGHEQAYGHSVLGGSALAALQDETGASRRIDPVRMATADVNLRAGKSAKSDQAWKYPGYNIVRAPNLTLGDNEYWDPKELPAAMPRRLQESNFKITINTNRKFEGNLEGLAIRAMTKAWAEICDELAQAMEKVRTRKAISKASEDALNLQLSRGGFTLGTDRLGNETLPFTTARNDVDM